MARCGVCFKHCEIPEGKVGFCGARGCKNGTVFPANYGRITSLALDPIEKKPLAGFYPGSMILSVGSYGCNLRCPFCQNSDISWSQRAFAYSEDAETITPEELAGLALRYANRGNIGVAFTYNEPLIGYEFVRDTTRLVNLNGMKNVIVTNGTAETEILDELLPFTDAFNIDLKGFTDRYYRYVLKGDRGQVMRFIERAVSYGRHVELTTLIIPNENDSEDEMREMCGYIASLGRTIPLHISRFFPKFRMTDRPPTDVSLIYRLADVAREYLDYVYTGNC